MLHIVTAGGAAPIARSNANAITVTLHLLTGAAQTGSSASQLCSTKSSQTAIHHVPPFPSREADAGCPEPDWRLSGGKAACREAPKPGHSGHRAVRPKLAVHLRALITIRLLLGAERRWTMTLARRSYFVMYAALGLFSFVHLTTGAVFPASYDREATKSVLFAAMCMTLYISKTDKPYLKKSIPLRAIGGISMLLALAVVATIVSGPS